MRISVLTFSIRIQNFSSFQIVRVRSIPSRNAFKVKKREFPPFGNGSVYYIQMHTQWSVTYTNLLCRYRFSTWVKTNSANIAQNWKSAVIICNGRWPLFWVGSTGQFHVGLYSFDPYIYRNSLCTEWKFVTTKHSAVIFWQIIIV